MNEERYAVEGRHRNMLIRIQCRSYTTALRSARSILKDNAAIDTVSIKNRKGEVIKVVKR